jgi:hypothetical protein
MATATVYTAAKVDELTSSAVVGASINDAGELILDRQGAEPINVGLAGPTGVEFDIQGADPLGFIKHVTLVDDGTPTDGWVNRFMGMFKAPALAARAVFFLNEYFELRLIPAKHNTTAFTMYVRENATVQPNARNATVPIMVLRDDREARTHQWGLYDQGVVKFGANAHVDVPQIVLGAADPVPAGLPAGTIIHRTS